MVDYDALIKHADEALNSIDSEIQIEKKLHKQQEAVRKATLPELEKAEKLAIEVSESSAKEIKNLQNFVKELMYLKEYDLAYHELKAEEVDAWAKKIADEVINSEDQIERLEKLEAYYTKYLIALKRTTASKPEFEATLKPKIDETVAQAEKYLATAGALALHVANLKKQLAELEKRRLYLEEERKKLKEFEFEEEKSLIAIIRNIERQLNKLDYIYEKLHGRKLEDYGELMSFLNKAMRSVNVNPGAAVNILASVDLTVLARSERRGELPEIITEWRQILNLIVRARSLYKKGLAPRGMTKKGGYEIKAGELE